MNDLFLEEALPFNLRPENDGQGPHKTSNDPGGWTSYGVTYQTWAAWETLHGRVPTLDAFKAQTWTAFIPIYRAQFWNACCCGSLGAVGIQVFDAAVMSGAGHATAFLQTVVGVEVNDIMTPITLRAAQEMDQRALARALTTERERFYDTRATAKYFARGWDRRAEACRDLVLDLLGVSPAAPPSPEAPVLKRSPPPDSADDLNAAELRSLNPTTE